MFRSSHKRLFLYIDLALNECIAASHPFRKKRETDEDTVLQCLRARSRNKPIESREVRPSSRRIPRNRRPLDYAAVLCSTGACTWTSSSKMAR
jgi:hypothetical protein